MTNKQTIYFFIIVAVVLTLVTVLVPEQYQKDNSYVFTNLGDEFSITLLSSQVSKALWSASYDDEYIELVDTVITPPRQQTSEVLGFWGKSEFIFRSIKSGSSEIVFTPLRPWETEEEGNSRVYTIEITEKSIQ